MLTSNIMHVKTGGGQWLFSPHLFGSCITFGN